MICKVGNRAFHGYLASKVLAGVKFTVVTGHCTGLAWRFRSRTLRIVISQGVFVYDKYGSCCKCLVRDNPRTDGEKEQQMRPLTFLLATLHGIHAMEFFFGLLIAVEVCGANMRGGPGAKAGNCFSLRRWFIFALKSPCLIPILEFGVIRLGRHSSTAQSWCQIGNGPPVNEPSRCEGCFKK